jgi:hypothetical protein
VSDLTAAIDEFLAKYPPDAQLEWQGRAPRTGRVDDPNPQTAWAATLTAACDKHTRNNPAPPNRKAPPA